MSEGLKAGQFADCMVPFTINPPQPPTISCSANPSTVATLAIRRPSPRRRTARRTVRSPTATARLRWIHVRHQFHRDAERPPALRLAPITVTCNVADDKGQTASATTTVTVQAPPEPPKPQTQQLCSITFNVNDKRRPARVDNEAKACLDDVALNLQRNADAKLAVVGNGEGKLASQRAVNTKAYLVGEKGVDASRISVYTGSGSDNNVTQTLIPSGATAPDMGTAIDESTVKAQSRTAAPARRGHRHHRSK